MNGQLLVLRTLAGFTLLTWMVTSIGIVSGAEIIFPNDRRAVIDVKRDCGARGDGVADDTAALQEAIDRSSAQDYTRTIYLPKGVYKISSTIVFRGPDWRKGVEGYGIGPWLWGQSRDETVIRLADRAEGFDNPAKPLEAIRGLSRPDGARMNADFFDRMVVNLTIDTGDNPGAVGIKFYSNNTGEMRDVLIRGNGALGLDMGFCDQNGPLLIQDVEIDGFAVGISTDHILNSQTLSRVTVRNASRVGLLHRGQVMAVEGLRILNAPLAIDTAGVLTIIDSRLEAAPGASGPAIRLGDGHLYAARIQTTGFSSAIAVSDAPAGDAAGPNVMEYSSHGFETLGNDPLTSGLLMIPEREPEAPFPTRPEDWVCANDFGARAGDEADDAEAIQRAIDSAAARGASTVYLLGGKRGDPNWYRLKQDIRVHGSVERIIGFGFARLLAGTGESDPRNRNNPPMFIVENVPDGPGTVIFQCLHVFGASPFGIDVRSTNRTVVVRAGDGRVTARENTTVFLSNCVGRLSLAQGAQIWARHWNTEGSGRGPKSNTHNEGGRLWVLGMKTEGVSTKIASLNGGRTEVLGVHNYNYTGTKDDTPFALVENATMSIAGYREVNFNNGWWKVPVLARLNGGEYQYPQQAWQTWSLLRIGSDVENVVFPQDAGVVDVTREPYLAKGDGRTDDTAAIQKALDDHPSANAIIYLPDGVYLVSDTLRWPEGAHGGAWMKRTILQGQSEQRTIIRLRERAPAFQDPAQSKAVIYTGGAPAQRFRNSIRNLTVEVSAGNPGATGVQFIANNQGSVRHLTVRSSGPDRAGLIGLDLGYTNEQGPCLIRHVTVEGFDIGIRNKHLVNSVTMEFITLRNQRQFGTINEGQVVNVRGLTSRNHVPAVRNTGSASVLTLVDADIQGSAASRELPAIINEKDAMLFARNVKTAGYSCSIRSDTNEGVPSPAVGEYTSHPVAGLFGGTPKESLNLPVKETPEVVWGDIATDWISPLAFGGRAGGEFDNSRALQQAMDSGRKTVYLPNGNWKFNGAVTVPAHVQRIIGCEAKLSGAGTLIIADGETPLRVERLDFLYSKAGIEHRSARTLVISSVTLGGGDYTAGRESGDLFLEDVCGGPWHFKGQNVWARQLNPESHETKIVNDGGTLWILGLKTERGGTLIENRPGARSELLGCFAYANTADEKPPMFINDNAALSFTMGEMVIRRQPFREVVREIRGSENKSLPMDAVPDRGGGSRVALYVGRPAAEEP